MDCRSKHIRLSRDELRKRCLHHADAGSERNLSRQGANTWHRNEDSMTKEN